MENIALVVLVFVGIIVIILIRTGFFRNNSHGSYSRNDDNWVNLGEFEQRKSVVRTNCSESVFDGFFAFLKRYKGGNIRRKNGKITSRTFLGKEKGDLKGIFFNVVIPNPNISISKKEEFRMFLINIGVTGVGDRPNYEERASKLKNNKVDEDEHRRKEVGNAGEEVVREEISKLSDLHFAVINGPVLKYGDTKKELDHLIVGKTGVFCLETKAFGMSNGEHSQASLFIDPGDKWIIRKNKINRALVSPTEQICSEKEIVEKILKDKNVNVHAVLVISNNKLFIKNNISLQYDVIRVDKLVEYIESFEDSLETKERLDILEMIDSSRIN